MSSEDEMLSRMWLNELNEYRANMLKEYRKMLKKAMMARLLRLRSLKEVTIDVDHHDESFVLIQYGIIMGQDDIETGHPYSLLFGYEGEVFMSKWGSHSLKCDPETEQHEDLDIKNPISLDPCEESLVLLEECILLAQEDDS
ncbi:unnamed protein product [Dovyalis caffra]|uniref:Uncharacterized protein n=1 Tax=Dovyalis caffra TaxID=77055 RepID=A0AAV1SGZ7_9ROSI|nr:unnamed protein product [Dovyalis caffra]